MWAAAKERLCTLGLYADALTGEAIVGHPDVGPYDRLLCTFAVQPAQELRPGEPLQGPHTLIGGAAGPRLFTAVADRADGWLPIGGVLDDYARYL
ncbi:hypothetical protein [Streptomyces sp. NPDC097981]|uniref:hypothetical protein n=1 Tax=Streptomyces sp. NPDC097981 TaxID=3155428 RepID=UPI00331A08ED